MYCIYFLCEESGQPFYIGMTYHFETRIQAHVSAAMSRAGRPHASSPNMRHIQAIVQNGGQMGVKELE